jgi:hypothetical protein
LTDYEAPPQHEEHHQVLLRDKRGKVLLKKRRIKVWVGEPIGDWILFRNIRIALHREGHDRFEGIVPDSE